MSTALGGAQPYGGRRAEDVLIRTSGTSTAEWAAACDELDAELSAPPWRPIAAVDAVATVEGRRVALVDLVALTRPGESHIGTSIPAGAVVPVAVPDEALRAAHTAED